MVLFLSVLILFALDFSQIPPFLDCVVKGNVELVKKHLPKENRLANVETFALTVLHLVNSWRLEVSYAEAATCIPLS